jgi:hypothetical protein
MASDDPYEKLMLSDLEIQPRAFDRPTSGLSSQHGAGVVRDGSVRDRVATGWAKCIVAARLRADSKGRVALISATLKSLGSPAGSRKIPQVRDYETLEREKRIAVCVILSAGLMLEEIDIELQNVGFTGREKRRTVLHCARKHETLKV